MAMRDKIEHAIQNQPCTVKDLIENPPLHFVKDLSDARHNANECDVLYKIFYSR